MDDELDPLLGIRRFESVNPYSMVNRCTGIAVYHECPLFELPDGIIVHDPEEPQRGLHMTSRSMIPPLYDPIALHQLLTPQNPASINKTLLALIFLTTKATRL